MERAEEPQANGRGPDEAARPESKELEALARLLGGRGAPHPRTNGSTGPLPEPVLDPDPASLAEDGDVVAGRFEVLHALRGPRLRGVQYVARDHAHEGREVVVELVRRAVAAGVDDLDGRLTGLVERLRAFPPEAVFALREHGRTLDRQVFLVSDVVHGETVRALLDRSGALRPAHALEIVHQVLQTLVQGHRRGLPHGAVGLDTVVLEDRVPWTDANPHGVGARLVEYGLDDLFRCGVRAERAATPHDDVRAVGTLLDELVGGSAAADLPRATGLDAPLSRWLERTRTAGAAGGFADADEALRTLEALPTWRPSPRAVPSRTGWLVAGALGVALAAALVTRPRATTDGGVAIAASSPTLGALRERLAEREAELEARTGQLDTLTRRLTQLERDNARLGVERDALRAERDALRTDGAAAPFAQLDAPDDGTAGPGELDAIRAELAKARTSEARLGELVADLEAARDRLQDDVAALLSDVEARARRDAPEQAGLRAALTAPLALGPEDVAALVARAGSEDVAAARDAFRRAALPLLLDEDGQQLQRARLHAVPGLVAWGELDPQASPTLARLALAARYLDPRSRLAVPDEADVALLRGDEPAADLPRWRATLLAAMELERAPGAAAGPLDARTVWLERGPDGARTWIVRTTTLDQAAVAEARAWRVRERGYDALARATGERERRIAQVGRRYLADDGARWADLGDPSLALVPAADVPQAGVDDTDLPPHLALSSADLARFRRALEAGPVLVVHHGGATTWLHPDLGVVARRGADGTERVLLHAPAR